MIELVLVSCVVETVTDWVVIGLILVVIDSVVDEQVTLPSFITQEIQSK